ncbi:hypothetical protein [Paracoccus wurundjeri]|uniref:hypothetical protein n=1 Tax=Paracoccus onubensis TaxID=1675788 RepID=UPI00272EFE92|nr:hypothetical protein [Paracoccus onubensis]
MARAPSRTVINDRLQIALQVAEDRGLTVYGYRIGETGDVHIITNAPTQANASEADKWLAEN